MALPDPVPGLVIHYSYLWHREHLAGREDGRKDRPCAIVAAIRVDDDGDTRVLVLPVTHRPPDEPRFAVEIPAPVKARLGLDEARSWIVLTEWNEFVWPGPDLRRVAGADDSSVAYGMLPPKLFESVRRQFLSIVQAHRARPVKRTE